MNCTHIGCNNQQLARKYCNKHYKQLMLSGELPRLRHHEYHGMYGTPEYYSWGHIISRCCNENDKRYADWGGRGIKVCDGIRYSFINFYKLVGARPDGMSIDRINNDGNYSCGNCHQCSINNWLMNVKWSTSYEQQINKRVYITNTSGSKNISWDSSRNLWTVVISRKKQTIYSACFNNYNYALDARNKVVDIYNKTKSINKYTYSYIGEDHKNKIPPFYGEYNPSAKLNWSLVNEIRKLWSEGGLYQKEIAERFDIKQSTVGHIVLNKSWVDLNYTPPIHRHKWQSKIMKINSI